MMIEIKIEREGERYYVTLPTEVTGVQVSIPASTWVGALGIAEAVAEAIPDRREVFIEDRVVKQRKRLVIAVDGSNETGWRLVAKEIA